MRWRGLVAATGSMLSVMGHIESLTVRCSQYALSGAYGGLRCPRSVRLRVPCRRAGQRVVGGKWKLVILFYLLQQPRRTGELRRLIPAITQKMLTQQLR